MMYLPLCIVAVSILLLESTYATEVYVPCISRTDMNITLDDMIHLSDVVLSGRILSHSASAGDFGTNKAQISYYYAYKSDNLLHRRALGHVQVENFLFLPRNGQSGLFFLIREPSCHLALYCMADLRGLSQSHDLARVLEHVSDLALIDMARDKVFVPPYPNPCDSNSTNYCSPYGSQCSIRNKPRDLPIRCTCNTGFYGNGTRCTATTEEAASAVCSDCSYGARCLKNLIKSPNSSTSNYRPVDCSCDHFGSCDQVKVSKVCGTNRVTYLSVCHLKSDSCRQQREIHVLHDGACSEESEVQPCMGMGSPLSTSAGLVRCNECPTQYFCHPTKQYQVCCPVKVPYGTQTPPANETETATDKDLESVTTTEMPTQSGDGISGSGQFSSDDEL